MIANKLRLPAALALTLLSLPTLAATDILGCATPEKDAATPLDKLHCEWREGRFDATLVELYAQGWHLVEAVFYEDTREVFYLERPAPAPAE